MQFRFFRDVSVPHDGLISQAPLGARNNGAIPPETEFVRTPFLSGWAARRRFKFPRIPHQVHTGQSDSILIKSAFVPSDGYKCHACLVSSYTRLEGRRVQFSVLNARKGGRQQLIFRSRYFRRFLCGFALRNAGIFPLYLLITRFRISVARLTLSATARKLRIGTSAVIPWSSVRHR